MNKLLLLFSILFSLNLNAQEFQWAKTFGGIENESISEMAIDDVGNIYVCGSYRDVMELSSSVTFTCAGINDGYIIKYDSDGTFIWAKSIGSDGNDACTSLDIDGMGNIIVAGTYSNTIDLNTDAGVQNTTSNGGTDVFVIKLNPSGNFIAAVSFGGTGGDSVTHLKTDSGNNWILTGAFFNTVDFNPGSGVNTIVSNQGNFADRYILKLNSSGVFQWVKNMNSRFITMYELLIDSADDIYLGGFFFNTVDFNPGTGVANLTAQMLSSITNDGFVLKLDSNGLYVWAKDIGSTGNDYVYALDFDSNEDLIISGTFNGQVTFIPGITLNSTDNGALYIAKMLSDGTITWVKAFGGTPRDLAVGEDNSIFICGNLIQTEDADPGLLVYPINTVGGDDIFISRYDPSGNLSWAHTTGGLGLDRPIKLLKTPTNELYVSGFFDETTDLNPSDETASFQSNGGYDVFILKLGLCTLPEAAGVIQGPIQLCALNTYPYSIDIVPGAAYYQWNLSGSNAFFIDSATNVISYTPLNLTAHQLFVRPVNTCGFGTPASINANAIGSGSYVASVNPGNEICSGQSVTLSLTAGTNTSVSWLDGYQSGVALALTETTTFYAQAINTSNGCIRYDTLVVTVNEAPVILAEISPNTPICQGSEVTLTASGAEIYTFSNGESNGEPFIADISELVTVTGTSGGCTATNFIDLMVNALPLITQNPVDQNIIPGGNASFSIVSGEPGTNFQWQVDTGNGFENIEDNSGPYTGSLSANLTITNADNSLNNNIYRCYITNFNCDIFSASAVLIISTTVGMESNFPVRTSAYPNPAIDYIYLDLPKSVKTYSFDLIDIQGRKLQTIKLDSTNTINTSKLASGWYTLVSRENSMNPIRFFKQ